MPGDRHEPDGGLPGPVVEGGDGADVVSIGGGDVVADGDVAGDVVDAGQRLGEGVGVVAVGVGGDPLGGHGGVAAGFQLAEGVDAGEVVNHVEVGVEAVGELFGVGAAYPFDQLPGQIG